jgi:Flp pilus assembly protein TadG
MSDQRPSNRFVAAGRRFLPAKGGNVAIIFAVALVPMVMATLGIIQYGMAVSIRTKLNTVADAAALQAVSSAAALTYVTSGTTGQTNATAMFNTQAATVHGVTISSLNVSVAPAAATSTSPGTLTATVTYAATLTSLAPGIFGSYFTSASGASTATATLPAYANFYLLLDNSPSMGIGASAADITKIGNVNGGCGFECHSPDALNNSGYPGYVNNGNISGVTTRLNALQTAVQTIISQAQSNQSLSGQYQFAVYTFHNSVTKVSGLSSNLSQISSDVNSIALPTNDQSTQIADAVNWLTQNVVTSGSGNGTKNSPYQFVFLVTDGVEDHYNFNGNYTGGSYETLTSPVGTWNGTAYASVMLWGTVCPNLKTKGATLAVIYTTYDNVGGTQYTSMVAPFVGNIAGALQNCASTGYFLQADDGSSINTALQQLFQAALQQVAHLSQ